jgi:ACT domain-containing protein
MSKENHVIVAIHITDRTKLVQDVQNVLTQFGCSIKTRLGLHEASLDYCSANGVIILELIGGESKAQELTEKLNAIYGVETKTVVFGHD